MPDYEERIIDGEVYRRNPGEDWKLIPSAEAVHKANTEPISPPKIDNAVKIQRAIRDAKTNAYFPPLAVIDAVRDIANGGVTGDPTGAINIGTGNLRNVLTNIGGNIGKSAGTFLGLPSGPGAIATAVAGYGAGSAIGSGIGQEFEAAAPDLFQPGYGSKDGPDRTVPSMGNAVSDAAMNALFDVGGAAALKGLKYVTPQAVGKYVTNSPTGTAAWKEAIENLQTGKYNPLNKRPISPPIDAEAVAAINSLPKVPTSVGEVLGEDNWFSRMQRFLLGEGQNSLTEKQNKAIGNELIQFKDDLGVPAPKPGLSTASQVGKLGAVTAQVGKERLGELESKAYTDITKFGGKAVVRTRPVIDKDSDINKFRIKMGQPPLPSEPGTAREVLGPIKLTGSNAAYKVNVAKIDKMLSQIDDPALQTELKDVRDRLNIGENLDLKDWDAVRATEAALNQLGNAKGLSQDYKRQLTEIHSTLVSDIEKNLSGKVKETAKHWKPGALKQYQDAKGMTKRKNDLYPEEITKAIESSVGEVPSIPNIRGGQPESFYDDILKSETDAFRLARVGDPKNARSAFMEKLTAKYQNPETGILAGDKMLADLSSGKTSAIADVVMNAHDKQKLRFLAKVSARVNPKLGRLSELAIQQGQDDWAFNLPGDVLLSALQGKAPGSFKRGLQKVAVKVGGGKFADSFLNNDAWARKIANNIGKPVTRPGMGREIADIITQIQGAKLLIQADGKEYEYDTDTKQMTEKK